MTASRHPLSLCARALSTLTLAFVAAASPQAFAQAAVGQGGEGYTPPQVQANPGLSRAEVAADLELWLRAGMAEFDRGEVGADVHSTEYRRSFAAYQALRAGPEYAEALRRHGGGGDQLAGSARSRQAY